MPLLRGERKKGHTADQRNYKARTMQGGFDYRATVQRGEGELAKNSVRHS